MATRTKTAVQTQSTAAAARLPPQDPEAEQSVLGAVLLDNQRLDVVRDIVQPEDFYRLAHRKIFTAMLGLSDKGEAIDLVTLTSRLRSEGALDDAGGPEYLAEIEGAVPLAINAGHWARRVRDKARLRRVIQASTSIAEEGYENPVDVPDYIQRSEAVFYRVTSEDVRTEVQVLGEAVHETYQALTDAALHGQALGLSTGFLELDHLLGGLQRSNLIVLAARPSMGKSAMALNLARNVTESSQKAVLFFSLEMSRRELVQRLLCAEARVNLNLMRNPQEISNDQWALLSEQVGHLEELPIYLDDTPAITVPTIRSRARRVMRETSGRLGAVFVDYLQLLEMEGTYDNRVLQIGQATRGLKNLAKELDIPVVCLSQLRRESEKNKDQRPMLSDLRESGAIEQDADVVCFLHRPSYYKELAGTAVPEDERDLALVIVAKQRSGPTGDAKLTFEREFTLFGNRDSRGGAPPAGVYGDTPYDVPEIAYAGPSFPPPEGGDDGGFGGDDTPF